MSEAIDTKRQGERENVLLRALNQIRDLRARVNELEAGAREPIAVIGMACRLPGGVSDPDGLWRLVRDRGDAIIEAPAERGMGQGWRGGFLRDIDRFDAPLFGISPREAATLDPQQRLFLEVAWEALERSGQPFAGLAGSATGVFLGVTNYDYCQRIMQEVSCADLEAHCLTSNASTFAAGRLSYLLGLSGPSLSLDTACSSSLVALHLACQSLRGGDCDMALVSGVNVLLSPEWFSVLSRASMLSPDGHCHTFDSKANGYVRGEGCVVFVLKRASDAVASRDPVHALLRGSCVNQDGQSAGLTVPNPNAQRAVIAGALRAAGVEPARVSYVEAHGTGTPLGDPIEVRALSSVMRPPGSKAAPLAIGSVKANIGHLEPAAGLAGLLKVILAMQHGELPPQALLQDVNAEIDLQAARLVIPREPAPWPADPPRIAGVSSFGASGTNAHVIVEDGRSAARAEAARLAAGGGGAEAIAERRDAPGRGACLAIFSARSRASLVEMAARHRDHLRAHPDLPIADVCATLDARARFSHRLAVAAAGAAELAAALDRFTAGEEAEDLPSGRAAAAPGPRVAFLFTGQGSQYAGMGRGLYAGEPVFRRAIEEADEVLAPLLGRSLTGLLFEEAEAGAIDQTRFTQPALVAIEVALARLWQSWGVQPEAVLGHSVGEYAAACVAGVFDLPDALRLVARRGALMQGLSEPGLMASVFAPVESVLEHIGLAGGVSIAAVNGPEHTVISGAAAAIEGLLAELTARGVKHRRIVTSHAFHSPLMEPILDAFEAEAAAVRCRAPGVTLLSNLTGRPFEPDELGARSMREHVRQPVQFHAGARWLLDHGFDAFVEVGPAPTLVGMVKRMAGEASPPRCLPSLRARRDDRATILTSLGALFAAGVDFDGEAVLAPFEAARVTLPTYPFEHRQHWYTPSAAGRAPAGPAEQGGARESLLGRRVDSPLAAQQFRAVYDPAVHPCLAECVVAGTRVVNVGVYVDAAFHASRQLGLDPAEAAILDLGIRAPMLLGPDERRPAWAVLTPDGSGETHFAVYSAPPAPEPSSEPAWVLHAEGRIGRVAGGATSSAALDEVRARCTAASSGSSFYEGLWRRQLFLGPSAQWIEEVWRGQGEALGRMRAPRPAEADAYRLHPGLLDACCQLFFAALPADLDPSAIFMIVEIQRLRLLRSQPAAASFCRASIRPGGAQERGFTGDVELFGAGGELVARAEAVTLRRATPEMLQNLGRAPAPGAAARAPQPGASSPADARRKLESELAAMADAARPGAVESLVAGAVAAVLRASADELDRAEPLGAMGLDSLMALELKDTIARRSGVALPLATFLEGASIHRLAADLLGDLTAAASAPSTPAAAPGAALAAEGAPTPAPVRTDAGDPFPLTDLQQAYLLGRGPGFELGGVSTQFLLEVDVSGLDLERLESSLDHLIARHGMLRAVIGPDGTQRVLPEVPPYRIRAVDLRGRAPAEVEESLRRTHDELAEQVLPVDRSPLVDVRASLLDGGVTRLHLVFDALVIDAWSTSLFLQEWGEVYRRGPGALAPLALTFRDYVLAGRDPDRAAQREHARAYWTARLDTLPPAPDLPLRVAPSSIGRPRFAHRSFTLDPARWSRLKAWAVQASLTPSALLCAAYAEVLAAWSRHPRFTLNLLFFNRRSSHPDISRVVGNFSATTLLEVDVDAGADIAARARRLNQRLWEDLDHADFSGVQVLRELNRRSADHARAAMPVVFASTINFGARDDDRGLGLAQHLIQLGDAGREVHTSIRTPQVWLDHQVLESGGALVANWDFVEELFPAGMIDDMFAAYRTLVERLAEDRSAWSEVGRVLAPPAQLEARARGNARTGAIPRGLLHHPFEETAARQPDRAAVIAADRVLTYGELDRLANGVAHWLRERGARPDDLVAVTLEKGWAQIAAVLGVLKSGAAYVPIDPQLPRERRRVLLEQTRARWLLGHDGADGEPDVERLAVDGPGLAGFERPPARTASETDLAYVIFTSGSTGTPKGVMIEHRSALNTIVDINRRFAVGPDDRLLALSSLSFDLSVYDVFGLLAAGGAMVLPRAAGTREPSHWLELMRAHGVTLWNSVPALMEMLVEHAAARGEELPGLRAVLMSGDWIPLSLPDRLRALRPEVDVYSLGGATEASIWSIIHPIGEVQPEWTSVPYGRPLTNQEMHVLDGALRPRPVWAQGRIFIGGVGVARGYLGDRARTAASFVHDPITDERLYDTGDLGRFLPSGDIELIGRDDLQVKVQGYRIELGEIEAALQQHPRVRAAAVTAPGVKLARKRLVAHVVPDPAAPPTADELRGWLRDKLPAYAVPHGYVMLEALPLTANGKVDRSALRSDEQPLHGEDDRAPSSQTERVLAELFAALLGRPEVGCRSSFFQLGGHSLLAVELLGHIRARLGRELPLAALFEHQTVERLAALLDADSGALERRPLVAIEPAGTRPPLFCVHPVGGNVGCYVPLARMLGASIPFYGIQAPERIEEGAAIEGMAAAYIAALREAQARGPYRLAGWSMGGVIAYEMAQQLHAAGERVSFLGLIDVRQGPAGPPEPLDPDGLLAWFVRDLIALGGAQPIDGREVELAPGAGLAGAYRLLVAERAIPAEIGADQVRRWFEAFERNMRALVVYRAAPYAGPIWFARGTDPAGAPRAVADSWIRIARSGELVELAGDHYSLMREQAEALACALRRALLEGESRTAARPSGGSSLSINQIKMKRR